MLVLVFSVALCTLATSAAARRGLRVLTPSDLVGERLEATTRKFFGPQKLNFSGPLVVLDHSDSRALCDTTLDRSSLAGAVVMFDGDVVCCSTERIYITMELTGVVALLSSSAFDQPGRFYFDHDGSRGTLTGANGMGFLDVTTKQSAALAASREAVFVHLSSPSPNKWQRFLSEWPMFICMRVVATLMNLMASMAALRVLRTLFRVAPVVSRVNIVLVCEAGLRLAHAVLLALGSWNGDLMPTPMWRFFLTGLCGWNLFSSATLAFHLREQVRALSSEQQSTFERRPCGAITVAVGVAAVLVDTVICTLFSRYVIPASSVRPVVGLVLLGEIAVGIYFISSAHNFKVDVLQVFVARTPHNACKSHLNYVIAWLAISGWSTLLSVVGLLLFMLNGYKSAVWWSVSLLVCTVGQTSKGIAHIKALDLPAQRQEVMPVASEEVNFSMEDIILRVVHGMRSHDNDDDNGETGDTLNPIGNLVLEHLSYIQSSPAPAFVMRGENIAICSAGMNRALGHSLLGMPLAAFPFATAEHAEHATSVVAQAHEGAENDDRDGIPVEVGQLNLLLRVDAASAFSAPIAITMNVSRIGVEGESVLVMIGREIDVPLFSLLQPADGGVMREASVVPSSQTPMQEVNLPSSEGTDHSSANHPADRLVQFLAESWPREYLGSPAHWDFDAVRDSRRVRIGWSDTSSLDSFVIERREKSRQTCATLRVAETRRRLVLKLRVLAIFLRAVSAFRISALQQASERLTFIAFAACPHPIRHHIRAFRSTTLKEHRQQVEEVKRVLER